MILVLGYFGYRTNKLDGQTVKTRNVYNLLTNCVTEDVDYYDTEDLKFNRLSALKMFYKVMRCDTLCYLPAYGNLRVLFPIIYCLSVLFHVKIHYFVVGGWLKDFLISLPLHRKMLSRIPGIHVETNKLKQGLGEEFHFKNVDIFPNFRNYNYNIQEFDDVASSCTSLTEKLWVVFVSRVEQSKGLDTLVKIADALVLKGYSGKVVFDFYGQKRDDYYDTCLSGNKMFNYKGVLQPEEVLGTLRKYDVLIFPTHYEGEGCPGILVEALSVGLPIIASNWKYNDEFVENGVNGFLCDTFDAEAYADSIIALADSGVRKVMSRQSYIKSQFYSVDRAKSQLLAIVKS